MRTETSPGRYLALPDGTGPHPGVVVIHEIFGLNENMRDICGRFAQAGYAALAVDLFAGRSRPLCMARIFAGMISGSLDRFGISNLKAALGDLAARPEIDADRLGAIGFCMGGTFAITWACTDERLKAIAPYYGIGPKPREAMRRSCPVVGSWPEKDFTSPAAGVLEAELTAGGVAHDLKVYPGAKHSFFNDRSPKSYDAAAAADSWKRVLAFFGEHVRRSG